MRSSTSYTLHNFHLKQQIHLTALTIPFSYFTRIRQSLPTSVCEHTLTSQKSIVLSIIDHRLLSLAPLITITLNNLSISTLTLPRTLTVQRTTKMNILK